MQTRSIWPCMLFHFTHNALQLVVGLSIPKWVESHPWLGRVARVGEDGHAFTPAVVVAGLVVSALILYWFRRQALKDLRLSDGAGAALADVGLSSGRAIAS